VGGGTGFAFSPQQSIDIRVFSAGLELASPTPSGSDFLFTMDQSPWSRPSAPAFQKKLFLPTT